MLYVTYKDVSYEISLRDLYLDHGYTPTERQIKESLAGYLEIDLRELNEYVVDFKTAHDAIVRPVAMVA